MHLFSTVTNIYWAYFVIRSTCILCYWVRELWTQDPFGSTGTSMKNTGGIFVGFVPTWSYWTMFLHFYWICLSRRELMHQTKTQAAIKEKNLRLNVQTKPLRKSTKLWLQQPWIHIEYQQTMMCMTCSNRSQFYFILFFGRNRPQYKTTIRKKIPYSTIAKWYKSQFREETATPHNRRWPIGLFCSVASENIWHGLHMALFQVNTLISPAIFHSWMKSQPTCVHVVFIWRVNQLILRLFAHFKNEKLSDYTCVQKHVIPYWSL